MNKPIVSVVKYEKPLESVRKVVDQSKLFDDIPTDAKIFIKPNIVYWNRHSNFPKWGVLTTSRVIEDAVVLLNERGIKDITIGEGIVTEDPKDDLTAADAFEKLGYNTLKERYGVKAINTFRSPFEKIDMGLDFKVNFSSVALAADYILDIPVLKTHAQAKASIAFKNLKGLISIASRKKFHSPDLVHDLNYNVSHLPNKLPPVLTIIDGIYTLERGPAIDGKAHRSNILVASKDILSADLVGASLLGFVPSEIPHLALAAKERNRPGDLSDIELVGESIESLASHHEWDFIYSDAGDLPLPFQKIGVEGLKYHKYDNSMCTYCSGLNGIILLAIKYSWKGKPYDKIEILTGKRMKPTEGNNKTILLGQCQCTLNKNDPCIKELIPIQGCPPAREDVVDALKQAGIKVQNAFFKGLDSGVGFLMAKYKGKPEFEESFFQIK
ncbi:MAG: DUF362 domain-containing protein [Promethearchaeota archaeon]